MEPIFSVVCDEPNGPVERTVYLMTLTPENLNRFWLAASPFHTLFGEEIGNDTEKFLSMFFSYDRDGNITSNSLFFIIDDFNGMFRITDIDHPNDAVVHYTFFDRRHKGRVPLMQAMILWLMNERGFDRLTAELPVYVKPHIMKFITENVGFVYEGKKRLATNYKGSKFHVSIYGITREDVLKWDSSSLVLSK